MGLSDRARRGLPIAGAAVLAAAAGLACLRTGVELEIVKRAAGIPDGENSGVGKFVNGAKALVTPLLVMTAAVAPLALIGGGLVLLFGGRRGMQIIGTSLGVLLLLGSVTALVD
jgi:hypothetical protein